MTPSKLSLHRSDRSLTVPVRNHWMHRLATLATVATVAAAATGCGPSISGATGPPPSTVAVPDAGRGPAPIGAPDADHPGPTTVVDGAPMGYRHDRAGARAAGVSFARLNEALVQMSEQAAAAAWRAMAAESAAEALVADVVARLATVRKRWPVGALTYRVAPLAVRVDEAASGGMDVSVWYVGVVAGAGLPTYEEWVTDTYRLVWERGDWRVASFSDAPGPRPEPGPQEADSAPEIDARLAGFESVG